MLEDYKSSLKNFETPESIVKKLDNKISLRQLQNIEVWISTQPAVYVSEFLFLRGHISIFKLVQSITSDFKKINEESKLKVQSCLKCIKSILNVNNSLNVVLNPKDIVIISLLVKSLDFVDITTKIMILDSKIFYFFIFIFIFLFFYFYFYFFYYFYFYFFSSFCYLFSS